MKCIYFIATTLLVGLHASFAIDSFVAGDGLSSWELYVVNDLIFQITMKKCPKISRPTASYLKDYISQSVKKAPRNEKQNEYFLEAYTNLMACFDHLDKNSKTPGKKLESVRFINNENDSPPKPTLKEKDEETSEESDEETQENGEEWHWKWMSKVANLFSSILRQKRDTEEVTENEKKVLKKYSDNAEVQTSTDAKNKFTNMLHEMNRVVQVSCPMKLEPTFSRKALLELVNWVSKDSHSLVATSIKYLSSKESFIQQVHECLQSL